MLVKLLTLFLQGFLLLGLVACGGNDPTSVASIAQDQSNPASWKDFSSALGRFSVTIPGSFNEVVAQSKAGSGSTMDVHTFNMVTKNVSIGFSVNYFDLPPEYASTPSKKLLDSARDGLASSLQVQQPNGGSVSKSTITSDKEITLGAYPGRELELENGKTHGLARMFLQGQRVYQVVATTYGNVDAATQGYAQKFLDSFSIK